MANQALTDRVLTEFTRTVPRLYRRLQSLQLGIARALAFSRSQIEILSILAEKGSLSVTDISEALVIAKPNVTNALDDLVLRGFVERQDQPGDRRVVILSLTPLGTDVRRRIRDSFRHLVTESLSNLAEEELELLDRGLHSLGKAIDQMRPENP